MAIFKFKPDPDAGEIFKGTELFPSKPKTQKLVAYMKGDDMGGFVDGVGEGVGVVLAVLGAGLGITYIKKLQEKSSSAAHRR